MNFVSRVRKMCGACAVAGGELYMTVCAASGADAPTSCNAAEVAIFLEVVARNHPLEITALPVIGAAAVLLITVTDDRQPLATANKIQEKEQIHGTKR